MIKNRFFRNVSVNTFQLIINQLFGLAIFYALSKGLDKNIFGQINWSLAVLLTVFGMLTFGIDQVIVKKIAAGYNRSSLFSAYLIHVLVSGTIFYCLLLLSWLLFPKFLSQETILLFIGIGKLAIFFSTPFKQLASGLEKFNTLMYMSIVSNIVRGTAVCILLLMDRLTLTSTLFIFIIGDLTELFVCIFLSRHLLQRPFRVQWNKRKQVLLLKESLPQTGVVFFTAIMSRFDWILVGLLISSARLAEYSFAYKIFEISTLPLLIIAPIMIPLFTRLQKKSGNIGNLLFFLEWQVIIASLVALLLNICWTPLIDFLTDGKYGMVNARTIFILSASMPLLYFSNFLWTIQFAKGNLRLVFTVMAVSFGVNLIACSILIPQYKNEGAAGAYFLTVLVQLVLYIQKKTLPLPTTRWYILFLWPVTAGMAGFISCRFTTGLAVRISVALFVYLGLVFFSRQLRVKDWKTLQSLYQ